MSGYDKSLNKVVTILTELFNGKKVKLFGYDVMLDMSKESVVFYTEFVSERYDNTGKVVKECKKKIGLNSINLGSFIDECLRLDGAYIDSLGSV